MKQLTLVLVALVACKRDVEKKCGAMGELAERCNKELPSESIGNMEEYCVIAFVQEHTSEAERRRCGASLADTMFDAMDDCTKAKTCDELTACFERNRCAFLFTSPTATGQFQCNASPKPTDGNPLSIVMSLTARMPR